MSSEKPLEELVEVGGHLLVRSEAEILKQMMDYNWLGAIDEAELQPGDIVVRDGHVIELRSDQMGFDTLSSQLKKLSRLERVSVDMVYELAGPWRHDNYDEDDIIRREGPLRRAKKLDHAGLDIRTVVFVKNGVRFEYKTSMPSSDEELSKVIESLLKGSYKDDKGNERFDPPKSHNSISSAGVYMDNEIKLSALIEQAIEQEDYRLWRRIREKVVPPEERLNGSVIWTSGKAIYQPPLEKFDEAVKKAEAHFHPGKLVDFYGQQIVASEADALEKLVEWNWVGSLNSTEPEPGDIIVEKGHVVDLRADKLGYEMGLHKHFKALKHLRKLRINMIYKTSGEGFWADTTGTDDDGSLRSRKARKIDIDYNKVRKMSIVENGITYEILTYAPSDEETRAKVIEELWKESYKDDELNGISDPTKSRNCMCISAGRYMGDVARLAALADRAREQNDYKLWGRIKSKVVPQEERLDGKIMRTGEASWAILELALKRAEVHFGRQHNYKQSIIETLINQGFYEENAHTVADLFQENIENGNPAEVSSKNQVYHITDRQGNKKVVKFVASEKEARIEALVNYHFSRDPILKHFIPRGDLKEPIEVMVNNAPMYITIQEDVRDKADKRFDYVLQHGTRQQVHEYLRYWMAVLARVHVIGTKIMNQIGNDDRALSLTKDKDKERIKGLYSILGRAFPKGLWRDLAQSDIERRNEFIHQDTRLENRLCQYIIDWGHAGRGNGLLDVARVLSDGIVQLKAGLSEEDYKGLISMYLTEKRSLLGIGNELTNGEVNAAYEEFKGMQWLYENAQSAYLESRGGIISPSEEQTKKIMIVDLPELEKKIDVPAIEKSVSERRLILPGEEFNPLEVEHQYVGIA
jgi:hypothetical protein